MVFGARSAALRPGASLQEAFSGWVVVGIRRVMDAFSSFNGDRRSWKAIPENPGGGWLNRLRLGPGRLGELSHTRPTPAALPGLPALASPRVSPEPRLGTSHQWPINRHISGQTVRPGGSSGGTPSSWGRTPGSRSSGGTPAPGGRGLHLPAHARYQGSHVGGFTLSGRHTLMFFKNRCS